MTIKKTLFLLFALGALLRIAAIELRPAGAMLIAPDEPEYLEIAQNVAHGNGFAFHGAPTAYRDMFFPTLAGGIVALFGTEHAVLYFQVLLDLATALLLYEIGRRRFSQKTGLILAGAWLLYPAAILYTSLFLTETLFLFLWVLALHAYTAWFASTPGNSPLPPFMGGLRGAILGVTLGLLLLTRATGVILALAILLHLLYQRRVKSALVVFVLMLVVSLPWMLRNAATVGRFSLNTNSGINLYIGNNPNATGAYRFDDVVTAPLDSTRGVGNETQRDLHATQLSLSYITQHPLATLKLWPKKLAYFWSTDMSLWAHYLPQPNAPSLAAKLRAAPLVLLVITGLIYTIFVAAGVVGLGLVKTAPFRGLLILQLLLGTLAAIVTYGLPRYHAPMIPALLLGAASLQSPGTWLNARPSRRVFIVALLLVLFVIWIAETITIVTG